MSSLWVRKTIGEKTYKSIAVYYHQLRHYAVTVPMIRRASRQFRKNKSHIHIDLTFGAGYAAILNEIVKLLIFEKSTGRHIRIRVISKFYSRSDKDCAITPFLDAIEDDNFAAFPAYAESSRAVFPALVSVPETRPYHVIALSIQDAHDLFFSRFRFKSGVIDEARTTFKGLTENKNNILGIHFRGTDKTRGDRWAEGNPIDAADFLRHAKAILKDKPEIEAVYVATDEQEFLDFARREITSRPVYGEDLKRHASHGMGLHTMPGDPHEKAKEAVLVMLMLSQCRYLLKTASFLSAWAKVINPDLVTYMPVMPRIETGGYVFPDKDVYETSEPIPA